MGKEKVDKRDSPEGANSVASELQRLSLVKKAGEKQLSMKNPLNLSPLIALIQSKPWGAFCQTNQLETSGIFNRKWSDIFQLKQSFPSNQTSIYISSEI